MFIQGEVSLFAGPVIGFRHEDVITLTSIAKNRGRGLVGAI